MGIFPSMRRGTRLGEYEIGQTGNAFTEMENGREGEREKLSNWLDFHYTYFTPQVFQVFDK